MIEEDLNWMIRDLGEAGYKGTYYLQNVVATGDKTMGNIAVPEKKLDQSLLVKPTGFALAFRNFS